MSKVPIKRYKVLWTIVMVLVFSLVVVLLAGNAGADESLVTPLLSVDPANPEISFGTDVDMDIRLDDITGVYGIQTELSFDHTVLQVTGAQLTPGACPQDDFVVTNSADNGAGTIDYVVTQLNPTAACDGGVVATINFECIAEGESDVLFTSSLISDKDALAIGHNTQGGSVKCTPSAILIKGYVVLQAWPNPAGVEVALYDGGGIVDGPVVVDGTGYFELIAPDDTETYFVYAKYPRYLDAVATGITGTGGTTIDLGVTMLRAGDIDGNGVIDILDLSALGGNFGKTSPQPWAP